MDYSANKLGNRFNNQCQDESLSQLSSQANFKKAAKLIRCSIRVCQKSIFGYPLICLYDLDGNFLYNSQKCTNGKYSEYPLSSLTEFEVSQADIGCQGKLQMGLDGSMSQIFKGANTYTEIYGAQYIVSKGLPPGTAPRIVNCGIPTSQWKVETNGSIIQLLKQKNYSQFLHLTTKPPVLSKNDGRYILEYDDRSIVASRSNFILVNAKDEKQTILLQFGKTGENEYILDFRHPLSPLQAFGFALSYLESKLSSPKIYGISKIFYTASVLQLSSDAWRSYGSGKEITTPLVGQSEPLQNRINDDKPDDVDDKPDDVDGDDVNPNVDINTGVINKSARTSVAERPFFTGRSNSRENMTNENTNNQSRINSRSSEIEIEIESRVSRSPNHNGYSSEGPTANKRPSLASTTSATSIISTFENRVFGSRDNSPVKGGFTTGSSSSVLSQDKSYRAQRSGKGYLLAPATRYKGLVRCDIRKTNKGVLTSPIYSLYTKDGSFLMSACKNSKSEIIITANDLVTGDNSNQEIAKLIYNREATQFQLFPIRSDTIVNNADILCGVIFRARGLPPGSGPRQVQVGVPQIGELDNVLPWKKDTSPKDMIDALKDMDLDQLIYLTNKIKKCNDDKFLLEYDDREVESHDKNFILTDATDEKLAIILQYGKTIGSATCILDFQYPLSPLQAFAIALSTQECALPSVKSDTRSSKLYTGRVHLSSETWKQNAQSFLNHATKISQLETPMKNTSSMDASEVEEKVESTNIDDKNYRQSIINNDKPPNKGYSKSRSSSSSSSMQDDGGSNSPIRTGHSSGKREDEDDSPRTSCGLLSPTTSSDLLTRRSDKLLLTSPIEKYSGLFRCYIKKTQANMFATPVYHLYSENDDTKLLHAQKSTNRKSKIVYNLTMNDDIVVAKLFPSSDGTLFELLDDSDMYDDSNCCTLAAITIKPRGSPPGRDPRLIRIVSPLLNEGDNITAWKTITDGGMTQRLTDRDYSNLSHLITRTPLTDSTDGKSSSGCAPFVVYDDREVQPSSRNCVVIDATKREDQHPNTLFQLGNSQIPSKYFLDFQYPLSPIQAFAIALSALESKISGAKVSGHSSKLYSGLRQASTEDWTKARSAAEVLYTPTNPQRSSVASQAPLVSENSIRRRTSSQLTDGESSTNLSSKSSNTNTTTTTTNNNNSNKNKSPKPPKLPFQGPVISTERRSNFNYQPRSRYNNGNDEKESEEYPPAEEPERTKNWKNKKRFSNNDCHNINRNWQQSRNNHDDDNNNLETVEMGVTTTDHEARRPVRTISLPAPDQAWESANRNGYDNEEIGPDANNTPGVSTYQTFSKNNYHYEEFYPRGYSPVDPPENLHQQQHHKSFSKTKLWRCGVHYQNSIPQILLQTRIALTDPTSQREGLLRCVIRSQSTTLLGTNPVYLMYTETGQFMMSAQKKRERKFDVYPISLVEHQVVSGGSHYLGKLRCNAEGTQFQLFDDTDNRDDAQCQELSAIAITSCGMPPGRNPRGFQVAMPKLTYNGKIPLWTAANDGDMLKYLKDRKFDKLAKLMSVDAIEFKTEGFTLEYEGRGADKSSRNFQLTDRRDSRSILLQLGKNEDGSFFLDFKYPLSPIQAFALALSSLDSKALGAKVKGIEVNSYRQADSSLYSPNYNIIQSSLNNSEQGNGNDDVETLERSHNRPLLPRNTIIDDSTVEDFNSSDAEGPSPASPNRKRTSSLNNNSKMSPKRVQELRNKSNATSLRRTTSLPQQEHYNNRRLELTAVKHSASTNFNENSGRSRGGYGNEDDAYYFNEEEEEEEEEDDVSTNHSNYDKRKLKSAQVDLSADYYNPLDRHQKNMSSSHSSSDYSPVVTRETSPSFQSDREGEGVLDTSAGRYRRSGTAAPPRESKIWRTQAPTSTTVRENIFNIRLILTSPVPKSVGMMRTVVTRTRCKDNPKYKGYIYTMYDMGGEGEGKFMMCSKKLVDKDKKLHSYPISSCETEVQIGGAKYLGKLRQNLDGDQFQIFDDSNVDESRCQQLGALTILPRGFPPGTSPRLMRVGLPLLDNDGNIASWNADKDTDMLRLVKSKNFQNLTHLQSKKAQQNQQTGEFSLSYDRRDLSKYDSSHKNCVIVKDGEEDQEIILQLGKAGGSLFVLDFQYPLSPFQAFAIALSSIDSKTAGAKIKGSPEVFRYSVPEISRRFSSWSSNNSKSMACIQDHQSNSSGNLNPISAKSSQLAFESNLSSPRIVTERSFRLATNIEEEEIKAPEYGNLTRQVAASMTRCYIKRKNYSSLAVFGSPTYSMFTSEDRKFIMTGRLQNKDNNMWLNVTNSESFNTDAKHFLGKIVSNLDVTAFKIYDNTVSADSVSLMDTDLCVVGAVAISIGSSQAGSLKKIEVCLPAVQDDSQRINIEYENCDLIAKLNQHEFSNIRYLHSKSPEWNEELGGYSLDFQGRVNLPSAKNFQLVMADDISTVMLQYDVVLDSSYSFRVRLSARKNNLSIS